MITSHEKNRPRNEGLESRNAVETAIAAAKGSGDTTWEGEAIRVRRTIRPWDSVLRPASESDPETES